MLVRPTAALYIGGMGSKKVNFYHGIATAMGYEREADEVYFGPNYANFVAVTGNNPAAQTAESLWWLTNAGARFGVDDTKEAREALGLTLQPSLAPWVALRLLPQGPTLSRADALVEHDTLPMDMTPSELVVPK